MTSPTRIELIGVPDVPLVGPGDDLAAMIADALEHNALRLCAGDVVVVAHKIVSKAEDRFVDLAAVRPSDRALAIAAETEKDPRLRSEEHTSELHHPSISYAVFCLKKKKNKQLSRYQFKKKYTTDKTKENIREH